MIIKKVTINNFRSYYRDNTFELKDGLTLIIGDNGDGKTTFFEALEWLFNTSTQEIKESNISLMRKKELEEGDSDRVSVSITFEHSDGTKIVEKSFLFTKLDNKIVISDFRFNGYECIGAERSIRGGADLLKKCFDADIRKYCLFAGEEKLNVFENDTALKSLVAKFSDIKEFDKYVALATSLEEKSAKAYKKELKSDDKTKARARELDDELTRLTNQINNTQSDLKKQQEVSDDYNGRIENLNNNEETRLKYKQIQSRLGVLNEKRLRLSSMIKINYNYKLLDDMWILCAFPDILKAYQMKISGFSRRRRKLQEADTLEKGKRQGIKQILDEMSTKKDDDAPSKLPWDVPDLETMMEMIHDHRCKVCGHEAPEGSPELEYMKQKVAEYKKHLEEKKKENDAAIAAEKPLFQFNYLNEMRTLSTSFSGEKQRDVIQLKNTIADNINFISARKKDLDEVEEEIELLEEDKKNLFIQANVSESMLNKDITDITGYFSQKQKADEEIIRLKYDLKQQLDKKAEIDEQYSELKPKSGMGKVYEKVHKALDLILKSFTKARKDNLDHFITDLTNKANEYLVKLNVGDFHGEVKIDVREDERARIYLMSNGERIMDPNGALKTTMYMSVLFAISDITTIKREEDYPLIFDAPTSSFGAVKEDLFYNIIDGINKQCIIVTKDLLEIDPVSGKGRLNEEKIDNLTCSVYRIQKDDGFDSNDLSTVRINIEHIK